MSAAGGTAATTTIFEPSSFGSNLTVRVEPESLDFSDGTDRLVIQENSFGGYTVTRSKAGYSGVQRGVYNGQGNLVQSTDSLSAPASSAFVDGLSSMQDFIAASGSTTYATSQSGVSIGGNGGAVINLINVKCRDAMIKDGLKMTFTGIGIGLAWLGGPWFGVPASILGTIEMHDAAVHVTNTCFPAAHS